MRPAIARHGRLAIAAWLALMLLCALLVSRSQFTTDLSAFLPRSPTPAQQLLLEQIRDGLASRLILIGIEGADAPTRAVLSRQIARHLRADPAFVSVDNGEPVNNERDRAFLFDHRYLLSPAVTPERFSVDGLHAALSDSIDLLASPAGLLVKSLLPRDPTGEMIQLLDQFDSSKRPNLVDGAWASRDGRRALLLLQTRASGSDTDAQQAAMAAIRQAFDGALSGTPQASPAPALRMTGPGVFSVNAREAIKSQVSRLSIIGMLLIATLLLLVYRSFAALALGFLPVASGALAGIAAVSLGFGTVHGITLGFGTALIGEAVDYSIYLFVQSEQGAAAPQDWRQRFWPTVRLGVLTSIFGFAALLLSGFPGLAQLGLYSIAGLLTAAAVTRYVLPHLLPTGFRIHDVTVIGQVLYRLLHGAAALRRAAALLLLAACAILVAQRATLWNHQLSSLSPVPPADVALDESLRADLGAPDVRYLVVVSGSSRESVLAAAEQVSAILHRQVEQGQLAGFDSPSRYLPSNATQLARQASLPAPVDLEKRLAQAVQGLPVRAERLAPFLAEVAAARRQPLLQAADLAGTSLAMPVDALLVRQERHWSALLPLTAPTAHGIDAGRLRTALSATPDVLLVDMKAESDQLYAGYLQQAILLSLGGLLAIVGLLLLVFRSPTRVLRIATPLAAAVITVTAGLAAFGQQLTILHLVGLLLVVAVGSNYALFFDGAAPPPDQARAPAGPSQPSPPAHGIAPRTLASLLFANLTAVAGFGLLAFSDVAILQALGVTVAPGVILALIYSAIFARPDDAS